ncbi:DUF4407 domain-containing protein [Nocardia terpenica]|uniref:DUF4407 domain-containing protein n=1 Tax=Nocardia terpenica TaxID=455432 RepID=A0A164H5G5_9NOCA|nr:DUF4407 domain-containing protein [Nocardia terpenica]KZM68218.1 hypothetical protein AWN90_09860 [Nocardia terpenica]NQE88900.1 DUF4407 domain-containing protein [Nocardia terpenica]
MTALTWLGGAGTEVSDRHERSGYLVTGIVVALFAAASAVVVGLAAHAAHWPLAVTAIAALLTVGVVGAVSRALATASVRLDGTGDATPASLRGSFFRRIDGAAATRIAIAVVTGVIVAELASTVLLGGTVDRQLDERAGRAVDAAPGVLTARDQLDRARADRTALDRIVAQAQADVDQALIVARCEYNPTPQCPQTKITGVPGRGPETQADTAALDDARARLTAAQGRITPLDNRIAERQQDLDRARAAAFTAGDRGLGARWLAMNDYTAGHPGALLLRLATIVAAVAGALLPLLLRRWRGETSLDRHATARAVTDRAEQHADTAIAVARAEARAETEKLRTEQELAAARLTAHADTAIDRERQRRRIVAAIGNIEIGITEPQRRAVAEFEALAALPAADIERKDAPVPDEPPANLPAPVSTVPAKKGGGLELPVIGTVPFTDTAARWIRPMVPSFVTSALDSALDTATSPLRTVRQAFEEAEEITFTLRRTRKVTVDTADSHGGHPEHVPAQALPTDRSAELSPRTGAPELDHRRARELPPGDSRG